jgi:TolB-like protein
MAPVSVQGAQAEMVSIAILPFDNMSGDPDQLYFSDGISEDIITELSRFRDLLVISRNSSFQFRGKANDVREIARKLGVQFVVEGSVRKAGNRVRITAQLIDATSTAHVWAERYDRDMTDVFEIQDEITRAVVPFVARHARSTVASRARSRPTESLSAYDCFLQARELFMSDLTAMQAEPLLLRAIEADPNFANAHALISMLHTIRYMNYGDARYLDEALASARRALDLDPDESRANHALGLVLTFLHRMDEAGHYLKRAIALNPNEVYPRADYANWMNYVGMTDDALREIEEVFRRDPYTADWFWDIRGSIEVSAGRYQEALGSYRRMKAVTPSGQCYQAICHVELGQIAEARDCLQRARLGMSGRTLESFIESRHRANPARARQLLDALRRAEPERPPE